ncbi:undecaprenyldiphospho-muramoylpentapeptide beta-N-acetylglucosaminyltransferase [Alteromonas facilis]|uniref:undecaprenyldiphospho-muramoylpentapeptide beta-N-acetylglucosaminyltransferase n=1 Tax=Alteromonas facilis TaxID=2048004 RepID=UPI000C294F6B|nr:undecaprenyldiphospho-muramoylpentapeptide beta-N-acetylglucosaminyltransferase [Alteromonas facilis]
MNSTASTNPTKTILIMAGGTGGHIFPGIAVAEYLTLHDWQVHWLGTPDHMEAQIVPKHGIPLHFVEVSGLRGKGIGQKIKSVWRLFTAIFKAMRIIRKVKPDAVLGMGGYASGAGGIAAKICRVPLLVHEQNAVLGLTNRWLAKIANRVMLGFGSAARQLGNASHVVVTGNPIRASIGQLAKQTDVTAQLPLKILIVGGSLGARPFNQALPAILARFSNCEIVHQTGKGNGQAVEEAYRHAGRTADLTVTEFLDNIGECYQWADLVICRAGAITVTEVSLAGIAAIFIPLPHAVDDHQTANAQSLVSRRAGYLIKQANMQDELPQLLKDIIDHPSQLEEIRLNALDCAISDAAKQVATQCELAIENKKRFSSRGAVL